MTDAALPAHRARFRRRVPHSSLGLGITTLWLGLIVLLLLIVLVILGTKKQE